MAKQANAKKIGIVVNTAWNILNFRLGLIKQLIADGHEVVAIAPADEYVPQIEATGARFLPLGQLDRKGSNPLKEMQLCRELYKAFKQEQLDLVLLYTIKPNIYGALAAKWAGIPSICTVTGLGYTFLHDNIVSKLAQGLYKYAFKRASWVAFQNRDDRQLFIDRKLVAQEKSLLIPGSGINTQVFAPVNGQEKPQAFTFLFVGRLLKDKGVNELLQAAKLLQQAQSEAQIWVVGGLDTDNPACIAPETLEAAQALGNLQYFGRSDKVKDFMAQADVVVLPSYREGLPRVMLEALAMSKAVITTAVAGCRETVEEGLNGYLIPAKDAQALAAAMLKMSQLPEEQLKKMGEAGRQMALNRFDEQIIIQHYKRLIKEL